MDAKVLDGFYGTQPLWKHEQFGVQQLEFPEVDTTKLESIDIPTNLRLGHQMEYVFKALLDASKRYDVLRSNILVDDNKQRLGELDFLVNDNVNNQCLHIEVAYKFYIVNPEITEPIYRLMGPNKRDMFYTKLDKLKEKQFPLLFHKSLLPLWDALDVNPFEIHQQGCFKAQLFVPFENKTVSIRPLNTACIRGKWIRFDDFDSKDFKEAQYYIPRKQEWVIKPHEKVTWATHFETLMEVNLRMVKKNAPMLWMRKSSGNIEKLFVVWW